MTRAISGLGARALFAASLWWVLVEGDVAAFAFGGPVILVALATRLAWTAPALPRIRPVGLVRLGFVFLAGLVRGGVDVARRVLSPRLPISPAWLYYDARLADSVPRKLLMVMISLMPGTLTVDDEGHHLRLHILLPAEEGPEKQIAALEENIARAFRSGG